MHTGACIQARTMASGTRCVVDNNNNNNNTNSHTLASLYISAQDTFIEYRNRTYIVRALRSVLLYALL